MKRLVNDPVLKKQLLSRYLWPGMGIPCGPEDSLTADMARFCRASPVAATGGIQGKEVLLIETINQTTLWNDSLNIMSDTSNYRRQRSASS